MYLYYWTKCVPGKFKEEVEKWWWDKELTWGWECLDIQSENKCEWRIKKRDFLNGANVLEVGE